jgi:hypothetical protein
VKGRLPEVAPPVYPHERYSTFVAPTEKSPIQSVGGLPAGAVQAAVNVAPGATEPGDAVRTNPGMLTTTELLVAPSVKVSFNM